ncbi:unnamed protein product [Camellia sinensis]
MSVAHRHRHRPLSNGLLISGPWKQGWRVRYEGNEWDSETLKVFVVPHSHNDPGWKLTVEEYYDRQLRHILDTIVEALSKDPCRKFIWEEMSYSERWWKDASETKKESFINLVKNAQLEIVGGGWVMNDERTHYELKKELAFSKNLEYIWRQSWDSEEALQVYDISGLPIMKEDVSIPSQRRYVGYWENTLSIPRGVDHGPPSVISPEPCSRELVRIRLYDTVNIGCLLCGLRVTREFLVSGIVHPWKSLRVAAEKLKKGSRSEPVEPHLVVQMDTESSVLYQKTCLDYCFEKPIKVEGIQEINLSGGGDTGKTNK